MAPVAGSNVPDRLRADGIVAPSVVAPSVVAPSVVAPSVVAPSVVAPSVVAPGVAAASIVADDIVADSLLAHSILAHGIAGIGSAAEGTVMGSVPGDRSGARPPWARAARAVLLGISSVGSLAALWFLFTGEPWAALRCFGAVCAVLFALLLALRGR